MKLSAIKPFILLFCIGLLWMTGCGKSNPEMDSYKANMDQFFENISYFNNAINGIDPDSESAVSELLSLLDSMEASFTQMAELPVPDVFTGVDELADDASSYMTEAVSLYHQALEGESVDEYVAEAAKENYDRANLRLQYIVSILHGDIPEEIFTAPDESSDGDSDNASDNASDIVDNVNDDSFTEAE